MNGGKYNPRPCAAYDDNGDIIAVADSEGELARILNITRSAVCHGLHKNNGRYIWIEESDD